MDRARFTQFFRTGCAQIIPHSPDVKEKEKTEIMENTENMKRNVNIEEIMEFNRRFVENKEYEEFKADKFPEKKLAILSCMDTRLTRLLPAALGLKNGDAKIIKNAGGVVTHPFGSVVRSLLVAIFELGVNEIMVIGHTDCGVQHLDADEVIEQLKERGITKETIDMIRYCGVDFNKWLSGFDTVDNSVSETVHRLRTHPLMPADVTINGYVMDSVTGALRPVNEAEEDHDGACYR